MPFEIEDQAFFPPILRQQQLEAISFMVMLLHTYKPLIQPMKHLLQQSSAWTDCCTGAGGPVIYLLNQGCQPEQLILIDRFLHLDGKLVNHPNVRLVEADVLQRVDGDGLVTVFNAFHHFSNEEQQQFLKTVAQQQRPVMIAEITRPDLLNFISITLAATVLHLLIAPFIKPFRWSRLLFTYLIPLNIITVLWDGWMSVGFGMRKSQFRKLESTLSGKHYAFTFKMYGPFWQRVFCLHGAPAET